MMWQTIRLMNLEMAKRYQRVGGGPCHATSCSAGACYTPDRTLLMQCMDVLCAVLWQVDLTLQARLRQIEQLIQTAVEEDRALALSNSPLA